MIIIQLACILDIIGPEKLPQYVQKPLSSGYFGTRRLNFSHNVDLICIIYVATQVIIIVVLIIVVVIIIIIVVIVNVIGYVGHGVEHRHDEAE